MNIAEACAYETWKNGRDVAGDGVATPQRCVGRLYDSGTAPLFLKSGTLTRTKLLRRNENVFDRRVVSVSTGWFCPPKRND